MFALYWNLFSDKMESEKMKINILDGCVSEFFHAFNDCGPEIGLRIPIDQVKDVVSAIKKANEAGFDAKILRYGQNEYLEIAKYGYKKKDDKKVVENLKKVAIEVSKEDYSNHINNLPLMLKTSSDTSLKEELKEAIKKLFKKQ